MSGDTAQQRLALRRNKAAARVRREFPPGTRVMGAPGNFGTVQRHIPALTSLGGVLIVDWDNGVTGRVTVVGLTRV